MKVELTFAGPVLAGKIGERVAITASASMEQKSRFPEARDAISGSHATTAL
jgi:hypothetical protein